MGNGDYAVSFRWSHYMVPDDISVADFTAYWRLEGVAHTAFVVPVPAATWLMVSGLLGLAGVASGCRSV